MQSAGKGAAAPGVADPRDIVYVPDTLDVPEQVLPDVSWIRILDQGEEGASVGFALAAVLNFLRAERGETELVSPIFLYDIARRYDEWSGVEHEGSSLRGALRGLMRHGAALERDMPTGPIVQNKASRTPSEEVLLRAAAAKPASYERVERNIEHLKAAVAELHAVLVAAATHAGWDRPADDGAIAYRPAVKARGGGMTGHHAFAVIGYTERGFIVQNSWGAEWGGFAVDGLRYPGCALWLFEDAAENLTDAWVVRMAAKAAVNVLAGYSSDAIGGPDLLEVRRDAQAFSFVLASREVDPPLAIGLFGDWGGGKSFFMEVMQEEIEGSVRRARSAPDTSPFFTQVVSIRFNAWHYLDADLWASLVTEVFDRLFEHIAPKADLSQALQAQLLEAQGLFEHAKRQLDDAKAARARADEALKEAIGAREREERSFAAQLDDIGALLGANRKVKHDLDGLARALGAKKLAESFTALDARAREVQSLGGRFALVLQTTLGGPGGWLRLVTLAAVLLLPLAVAAGIEWLQAELVLEIDSVHAFAAQLSTLLAGVTAWLGDLARRGGSFVTALENAHRELEARRAKRMQEATAKEVHALQVAREREQAARAALQEAERRVQTIEREIAEQAPGRLIYRFIEERASSGEYRSRLGIVSLVRRDFERLSRLFERGKTDAAARQIMPVERIILYIDDLDRCKPERVVEVLEAVHLLLAFPLFMVVVAVDPRWLRRCLEKHYPDLLALRSETASAPGDVLPSRPATAQDYLEKIFQVPFTLQPLGGEGFRKLVRGLAAPKVAAAAPAPAPDAATGAAPAGAAGAGAPSAAPSGTSGATAGQAPAPAGSPPPPVPAPAAQPTPPTEAETIERLTISAWELRDIQRLAALFRTPRTVKRFINTYRFLRASLPPNERATFVGTEPDPGDYRAVIVLLAIVVSYPNIALPFLQRLLDFDQSHRGAQGWRAFLKSVAAGQARARRAARTGREPRKPAASGTPAVVAPATWEDLEWRQLCAALSALDGGAAGSEDFPPAQLDAFSRWIPRVARYSFSLSALLRSGQ